MIFFIPPSDYLTLRGKKCLIKGISLENAELTPDLDYNTGIDLFRGVPPMILMELALKF